jgi:hypothetical protein
MRPGLFLSIPRPRCAPPASSADHSTCQFLKLDPVGQARTNEFVAAPKIMRCMAHRKSGIARKRRNKLPKRCNYFPTFISHPRTCSTRPGHVPPTPPGCADAVATRSPRASSITAREVFAHVQASAPCAALSCRSVSRVGVAIFAAAVFLLRCRVWRLTQSCRARVNGAVPSPPCGL